jgi:LuxR family transcriptional regulator
VTEALSLIVAIGEAETADRAWALATAHFARLGFARVNYGYTWFRHGRSMGDPDDALFLTTCDADYARRYFANGFFARTPVFRWAETHAGSCTWAWVKVAAARGELTPDEVEAVRINQELGVTAGISVSFPATSSRAKGAIGLIADPGLDEAAVEEVYASRRDEILAVAHMLHLRLVHLPHPGRLRSLSPRQAEALEWVADGKTTQDIALLMGVSAAMVEKHLRLARESLAVETTAQAVAKASLMNMIFTRPLAPGALPPGRAAR